MTLYWVAKAGKWPRGHIAGGVERDLRRYLLDELRALRRRVPLGDLAEVLVAATDAGLIQLVDSDEMRLSLGDLGPKLEAGAAKSAERAARQAGKRVVLDSLRPRLQSWLRDHVAELVQATRDTNLAAVKAVVKAGINAGRHPARLAKDVQQVIGLTEQQAVAVARRRESLLADPDISTERANSLADGYAERLLKQRAENIARTEAATAVNRGRAELWTQLAEDGELDEGQLKRWDATLDGATCAICQEMGQRAPIPVTEMWELPSGAIVPSPPAHPRCRCDELLV